MESALMQRAISAPDAGEQRVESTQCPPSAKPQVIIRDAKEAEEAERSRIQAAQEELRNAFSEWVKAAGGLAALTTALDQRPSYENKIRDAIAGRGERSVQLDWLAALLDDPAAAPLIAAWFCERCGFEPPVKSRVVTDEEIARASRAVLAEMSDRDPEMGGVLQAKVARVLGVRVEKVRL
jgi:hypothetical protein